MHDPNLTAFLRGQSVELDREADAIDLKRDREQSLKNEIGAAYFAGAAFFARNLARSYLEQIPTEEHEWDCTPADLFDVEEVAA